MLGLLCCYCGKRREQPQKPWCRPHCLKMLLRWHAFERLREFDPGLEGMTLTVRSTTRGGEPFQAEVSRLYPADSLRGALQGRVIHPYGLIDGVERVEVVDSDGKKITASHPERLFAWLLRSNQTPDFIAETMA